MPSPSSSSFSRPVRLALLALLLGTGGALATLFGCVESAVDTGAGGKGTAGNSQAGSGPGGSSNGGSSTGGSSTGAGGNSGAGVGGSSSGAAEFIDPPAAFATDGIHVAPGGSDSSGDGSMEKPYKTIQYALDNAAKPGATVLLHGGTYQEQVRIRHSKLVLQAIQGEKAHVTCPVSTDENNPPLCVEIDAETEGVTLRGLEISGGFYAVYLGSQWDYDDTPLDNLTAHGVVIEDCKIHDSGRDVVKLPAGCDDVTIRRCEIYNSGMGYPPGSHRKRRTQRGSMS